MKNNYLEEAISIGNQLLDTAERDEHGLSWKTAGMGKSKEIIWEKSESLYSGVSGIALFLITLSQQTHDKKYLHAAEETMQWVNWYTKEHPTDYYAFFTGRMAVSFVHLKLYEATQKKRYLTHALTIAKDNQSFLQSPRAMYELINGISGTLLGLLHLHAATNESWILDYIQQYVDKLLQNAHFDTSGIYWDTDQTQIRPLCGFSHGSAGIGFVFLELGHYFQNPAFYYVAEQAFAYENNYFDKEKKNWPDFRINMYTEEDTEKFEKEFLKGNLAALTTSHDMNAWCHGAAGIGLSRLRAAELSPNKQHLTDIKRSLTRTRLMNLRPNTLCHGEGGNADLFIEGYVSLKKKSLLQHAENVGEMTLLQKKTAKKYRCGIPYSSPDQPEDPSLFNGIAGIGYFLLRLANPQEVPSILAPKVATVTTETTLESFTSAYIRQQLLETTFRRTIQKLEQFASQKSKRYFTSKSVKQTEVASFITFVKKLITTLPLDQQHELKDIFMLELQKRQLQQTNISSGLLYIKERINKKAAAKLISRSDTTLVKKQFQLAPEVNIFEIKHPSFNAFLLKLTPHGVEELPINQFCSLVLQSFSQQTRIVDVIEKIIMLYKPQSPDDKKMVTEKTIAQIREAIIYGILLPTAVKTLDKEV
jgi:hypothetical protein